MLDRMNTDTICRNLEVDGWVSPVEHPLLILVGLTGVGKTTLVRALAKQGLKFSLLPNRRALTDQFIIPTVLKMDGVEHPQDTTCRLLRFAYTRRYRQLFPAGMVQVLSQLQMPRCQFSAPLVFDGLRGEQELRYATMMLPQAKFLVLEAPNDVRLKRILHRHDPFDQVMPSGPNSTTAAIAPLKHLADLGWLEADTLFSPEQIQKILHEVNQGCFSIQRLKNALKIIVEEQIHYDPDTARSVLARSASSRTLFIDTTRLTPDAIVQKVEDFYPLLS